MGESRWARRMDDVSVPKFSLSLLGRFALAGPDGPVDLPNKKLAGLLAYLACTAPTPQPREKLATLLWGSHFEAQARQNLRQALFRLRRMLERSSAMARRSCWRPARSIAIRPGSGR
jgi:DNA-binding SARP family transcriptional activator